MPLRLRLFCSLDWGFRLFLLGTLFLILAGQETVRLASAQESDSNTCVLLDLDGSEISIPAKTDFTVLCFLGTECPLAKLYAPRLVNLAKEFEDQGFSFVGINSNQQDSKQEWSKFAVDNKIKFAIAKDMNNVVADQFHIQRTPEVVLLSAKGAILYRGRIDDQYSPGIIRNKPKRQDLRTAIQELIAGKPVSVSATEPEGCLLGRVKEQVANAKVTFTSHIASILQSHCVECHRSGDIGPFVLDDYDEVVGWGEMIVETIDNGRMPPWHADPDHGEFRNARQMSAKEKELVRQWVADGSPLGVKDDLPKSSPRIEGWRLTQEPDLVVEMRKLPFSIPADGSIEYQYFVVDPGFKKDKWVSEAEVIPGNRSVVHHSIVFIRPPDGQRPVGVGWLGAYVPGQLPLKFDSTRARRVPAGSKLVFQQHYTPNGIEQEDTTKIGMVFVDEAEVQNELLTLIAINQEFEIPPNSAETNVEANVRWFPRDGKLLSVSPHMHYRGKSFVGWAKQSNEVGNNTLLKVPRYDFNWQHIYEFKEPMPLKDVDELEIKVTFDNSDDNPFNPNPSEYVTWGDQTWEEMAIAFFDVSRPRHVEDQALPKTQVVQVIEKPAKVKYSDEVNKLASDFVKSYFEKNDSNKDGKLSREEVPLAASWSFDYIDVDDDSVLTREEVENRAKRGYKLKRDNR